MKLIVLLFLFVAFLSSCSATPSKPVTEVRIPFMERPSLHRVYADELLRLALESTEKEYGPFKIIQQPNETVIDQQLTDVSSNHLSVAVAMPGTQWEQKAQRVPFPLMKGLASYRLFFINQETQAAIDQVATLEDLRGFSIGQGQGWSTARILEQQGFNVVFAPNYDSLFPGLTAGRYELLMRGVYEMEVEFFANKISMPDLAIAENVAIYTYLPMYFFVSKNQPQLAERIEYGLKKLYGSGELDTLFNQHFWSALTLLDIENRKVFYIRNSNIDGSYFEHDKPYLLQGVHK